MHNGEVESAPFNYRRPTDIFSKVPFQYIYNLLCCYFVEKCMLVQCVRYNVGTQLTNKVTDI